MITPEQFAQLLPLATAWAEQQEALILQDGLPLTDSGLADARALGVSQPERVRLLNVAAIPLPEDPALRAAAQTTQLITPSTAGLTLRYGILIRSDCWEQRRLVAHELVHTSQYERLGGIAPFLQQYLAECVTIGYPDAPMEQEAITKSVQFDQ